MSELIEEIKAQEASNQNSKEMASDLTSKLLDRNGFRSGRVSLSLNVSLRWSHSLKSHNKSSRPSIPFQDQCLLMDAYPLDWESLWAFIPILCASVGICITLHVVAVFIIYNRNGLKEQCSVI